jgi:hypothetical protein
VQANVSLTRTVYPIGSDISIPCDVDGYPIPHVVWYKDEQLLEPSERIHITGEYNCEHSVNLHVVREIKFIFHRCHCYICRQVNVFKTFLWNSSISIVTRLQPGHLGSSF